MNKEHKIITVQIGNPTDEDGASLVEGIVIGEKESENGGKVYRLLVAHPIYGLAIAKTAFTNKKELKLDFKCNYYSPEKEVFPAILVISPVPLRVLDNLKR